MRQSAHGPWQTSQACHNREAPRHRENGTSFSKHTSTEFVCLYHWLTIRTKFAGLILALAHFHQNQHQEPQAPLMAKKGSSGASRECIAENFAVENFTL